MEWIVILAFLVLPLALVLLVLWAVFQAGRRAGEAAVLRELASRDSGPRR